VFVPADPARGTRPRLVVPVRAGGEWLGSIWAVVDEQPPAPLVAELVHTASVVALHLLRLRAQADLTRRVSADRLRAALSGRAAGAEEWLPPGPWRVVVLGAPGDPGRRLDLWESLCRRRAWPQPLLADLEGRVYAVVRADGSGPGAWEWLVGVVADARAEELDLTARAGRVARRVAELGRSRDEAVETELVARPDDPGASHERLWAEVTVARAARSVGTEPLGPVALLTAHDDAHRTDYVRTLAAWLDHPGEPSRAAGVLHVHPNTLRYRMARIADAAGLDLADPVVRLAVRLQLAAVQVRGPQPPA
jgi:hypothetical protein